MPTANMQHIRPAAKAEHGDLEVKTGSWEIKALDDAGVFAIYMAAFGNVDRGGDVIDPGAFTNLDDYAKSGWIGINHQMDDLPVAFPLSAVQDSRGLLIRGQFHTTPAGQACRTVVKERMAAGKTCSGSIGYKINPGGSHPDFVDGKQVRRLDSLSIFESSYVNLPMNTAATALSAKSLKFKADSLNSAGSAFAKSLIGSGKVSSGAWSFEGADGDALLGGADGSDWATFGKCFLVTSSDGKPNTKGHWKYPFAKKVGGTITLFTAALSAIASRASGQGLSSVSDLASSLLASTKPDGGKGANKVEAPVITIDALKDWLDLQTKSGRALSKSNHAKLKEFHAKLSTCCAGMKDFLDANAPSDGSDDSANDDGAADNQPADGKAKAGNPRNVAGNGFAADDKPNGANTAADIPKGKSADLTLAEYQKQKQQQFDALQARVLRDVHRFARA